MTKHVRQIQPFRAAARTLGAVLLFAAASLGHAQPTLRAGYAQDGGLYRGAAGVSFPSGYAGAIGAAKWSLAWAVELASWHSQATSNQRSQVADIGFTPSLRLSAADFADVVPYFDLGIGVHWLTADSLGDRQLGTSFQFGEQLGIGVQFGQRREFAVALQVLHESNGDIKQPNNGLTVWGARFEYRLP